MRKPVLLLPGASVPVPVAPHPPLFLPVAADVPLTPEDFGIHEADSPFTPSVLAEKFRCSTKTVIRMIEDGLLRALPLRDDGPKRIPYIELVYFFMRRQDVNVN